MSPCCGRIRLQLTCQNGVYTLLGTSPDGTTASNTATSPCDSFLLAFNGVPFADCDGGTLYVSTSPVGCSSSSSSESVSNVSESVSSVSESSGSQAVCCTDLPDTLHAVFGGGISSWGTITLTKSGATWLYSGVSNPTQATLSDCVACTDGNGITYDFVGSYSGGFGLTWVMANCDSSVEGIEETITCMPFEITGYIYDTSSMGLLGTVVITE